MAHFAKLGPNNTVESVIVIDNQQLIDSDGKESESLGSKFISQKLKLPGRWVQTSYNNNFRIRFASRGYTYNEELDAFIPPKPYPSWILNESTVDWEAPKENVGIGTTI